MGSAIEANLPDTAAKKGGVKDSRRLAEGLVLMSSLPVDQAGYFLQELPDKEDFRRDVLAVACGLDRQDKNFEADSQRLLTAAVKSGILAEETIEGATKYKFGAPDTQVALYKVYTRTFRDKFNRWTKADSPVKGEVNTVRQIRFLKEQAALRRWNWARLPDRNRLIEIDLDPQVQDAFDPTPKEDRPGFSRSERHRIMTAISGSSNVPGIKKEEIGEGQGWVHMFRDNEGTLDKIEKQDIRKVSRQLRIYFTEKAVNSMLSSLSPGISEFHFDIARLDTLTEAVEGDNWIKAVRLEIMGYLENNRSNLGRLPIKEFYDNFLASYFKTANFEQQIHQALEDRRRLVDIMAATDKKNRWETLVAKFSEAKRGQVASALRQVISLQAARTGQGYKEKGRISVPDQSFFAYVEPQYTQGRHLFERNGYVYIGDVDEYGGENRKYMLYMLDWDKYYPELFRGNIAGRMTEAGNRTV